VRQPVSGRLLRFDNLGDARALFLKVRVPLNAVLALPLNIAGPIERVVGLQFRTRNLNAKLSEPLREVNPSAQFR
jgi:hypothetical protein